MNTYYSKIGVFYIAILLIIGIPTAGVALGIILSPPESAHRYAGVELFLIVPLVILLTYPCKYTFGDNELVVKCGLLTYLKIPYSQIKEFRESRSIANAPALSCDRILITFKSDQKIYGIPFLKIESVLVSPKYKKDFLQKLAEVVG